MFPTIARIALEDVTGGQARQQRIASGGGKNNTNDAMTQAVSSLNSTLQSIQTKTTNDANSEGQTMQMLNLMMQRGG